ncbi:MlaD protein domain-containing protein [Desulfonema limicola]|uniref:MlaD protein domain-containing protein n=1 Tax=Desulfonema limicola TaxID=45656 RepID=A0A975BAV4_9BACT|nr:MlaD family protein [Desulfonema limicola]QTA81952.1 MlaD protein domain-containing protein [Desulfonema limicola]
MSRKTNPATIGIFVIAAIILTGAGVLIFGSGKFLKDTKSYILYFDGNVAGLKIGAPVTFKGVNIGSVSKILLHFDSNDMSLRIPVIIEIENDQIEDINNKTRILADKNNLVLELVNKGLKAQLKVQSLVTGQLYIEFDFHPQKPIRLAGVETLAYDTRLPELPTIPSEIEELQRTLEKIPLETMIHKAIAALESIENIISSTQTKEALSALSNTMKNIEKLAVTANYKIDDLASGSQGVLNDAQAFLQSADTLVREIDKQIKPVASNINTTFKTASSSLKKADKTLMSIENIAGSNSQLQYELTNTLKELSAAARSIRIFAEYLERHPEALIQGKRGN